MFHFCNMVLKVLSLFLLSLVTVANSAGAVNGQVARAVPEWFRTGVTYQIMPRCMSEAGTLKGAEAHLERLADLGVNTVYLTPVNVADTDPDPQWWSLRQRKSGFNDPRNPYRAGDYFHVDPEYGCDADLSDFVSHAHALGIHVLLDMVFYHCGPSARVLKQHPEYFQHNADGSVKLGKWHFPIFDYGRKDTRAYIKSVMSYYVCAYDVDGFRLDVPDNIPLDFWEEARDAMDALRPGIVLAAEGERPENTLKAFDINYSMPVCRKLRKDLDAFFLDNKPLDASSIRRNHEQWNSVCPAGTLLWSHTENHDTATDCFFDRHEKRWGNACCSLCMAFVFAIDGVPFIFCGEEACHDGRVSLFGHEGCWIDWGPALASPAAGRRCDDLRRWMQMRKRYPSLTHGATVWLDNDKPSAVCSFIRSDGVSQDVVFVGNFTEKTVKVKLADGSRYVLEPWGFVFEPKHQSI